MALLENLEIATGLKLQLDEIRPLSTEIEQKIMQKFRLDWNYNSTNIEGNTLTYGETKALLLFGHTAQAKPLRDHLEMTGHDEAIKYIEEVVKQERPLNENFVRELHKLILKEPYQVDGITEDGEKVKKWVKIGQYKTSPNHVKTKTGEIFRFSEPEETPAKMNDLISWYSEKLKSGKDHPIVFATEFHYRFVRIHPFDDGNGRLARLLMNFILMQKGYPPAIIKTEEKENYYSALEQADAGNLDFFFEYVSEQVLNSLNIMIKGAKGEDIEDPDDLDKKLQLLKKRLGEDVNSKVKVKKTPEAVKDVLEKSIKPLLIALEKKLKEFDALSKAREVHIYIKNHHVHSNDFTKTISTIEGMELKFDKTFSSIIFDCVYQGVVNVTKSLNFKGFRFSLSFDEFVYEIQGNGIKKHISKRYDDYFDEDEITTIVSYLGNYLLNVFEEIIQKHQK